MNVSAGEDIPDTIERIFSIRIGIFRLSGSTFDVPMMAPNGTRFGGWLLNTSDNRF